MSGYAWIHPPQLSQSQHATFQQKLEQRAATALARCDGKRCNNEAGNVTDIIRKDFDLAAFVASANLAYKADTADTSNSNRGLSECAGSDIDSCLREPGRPYPYPVVRPLSLEVNVEKIPIDNSWGASPLSSKPPPQSKCSPQVQSPQVPPQPPSTQVRHRPQVSPLPQQPLPPCVCVWLRRCLRLHDNPLLCAALDQCESLRLPSSGVRLLVVYASTPVSEKFFVGANNARRARFIDGHLNELARKLAEGGGRLTRFNLAQRGTATDLAQARTRMPAVGGAMPVADLLTSLQRQFLFSDLFVERCWNPHEIEEENLATGAISSLTNEGEGSRIRVHAVCCENLVPDFDDLVAKDSGGRGRLLHDQPLSYNPFLKRLLRDDAALIQPPAPTILPVGSSYTTTAADAAATGTRPAPRGMRDGLEGRPCVFPPSPPLGEMPLRLRQYLSPSPSGPLQPSQPLQQQPARGSVVAAAAAAAAGGDDDALALPLLPGEDAALLHLQRYVLERKPWVLKFSKPDTCAMSARGATLAATSLAATPARRGGATPKQGGGREKRPQQKSTDDSSAAIPLEGCFSTSGLSPYLSSGALSVRYVHQQLRLIEREAEIKQQQQQQQQRQHVLQTTRVGVKVAELNINDRSAKHKKKQR